MNSPKDTLTSRQLLVIIISVVVGVQIFTMPRALAESAGRDGWLSLLLGGAWAVAAATGTAFLGSLFPRQAPYVWLSRLVGKKGSICLSILGGLFYLLVTGVVLRLFADVLRVYLLPRTPSEVIMITFLLSVGYAVSHGINPLARVTQIFFLFGILPSFLLMVFFQREVDIGELLPVLADGIGPVVKGFLPAYGTFGGWGIVVLLLQFMDRPQEAVKATLLGVSLTLLLYLGVFVATLATFGPAETRDLLYPVVGLIREMEGIGGFIEKLDLVFLSAWILSVFVTVSFVYYVALLTVSQPVGCKNLTSWVYCGLPVVYFLALLPEGYLAAESLSSWLSYGSFGLSLLVPVLLVLAWIRMRQGGINDEEKT